VDVERAVGNIRAVRHFLPEPLRREDLLAILDAGRRAGSSKNLQRWHFIVINDRDRLANLAEVGESAAHLAGGGSAVAIVTPDPRASDAPLSITWDSGRAAQNMMLVAWGRGIGSVPATVYEQQLCRAVLGYPEERHCEYILNFGYPAAARLIERPLRKGGRAALGDIVFFEHWGAKGG
jgi:nitroreductase